jgi:hypothetical protein
LAGDGRRNYGSTGAERFAFVDECSTNVSLRPLYAWSPRGERALCSAPRNGGANVTLLSPAWRSRAWDHRSRWKGRAPGRSSKRVRGGGASPEPALGTGRGDGQPHGPQGRAGEGSHRGARLRVRLPAALLARLQPHRAGLLQAQGVATQGRSSHPRGADRGHGSGVVHHQRPGRLGLLRPLRLPVRGPTAMTAALAVVWHQLLGGMPERELGIRTTDTRTRPSP